VPGRRSSRESRGGKKRTRRNRSSECRQRQQTFRAGKLKLRYRENLSRDWSRELKRDNKGGPDPPVLKDGRAPNEKQSGSDSSKKNYGSRHLKNGRARWGGGHCATGKFLQRQEPGKLLMFELKNAIRAKDWNFTRNATRELKVRVRWVPTRYHSVNARQ